MSFLSIAQRGWSLLTIIICLTCALSLASAQSASHYKPRDPPLGSLSKYNAATSQYEPVTFDSRYIYYRISVIFNETFADLFNPDPTDYTLISAVSSGDVLDSTTGVKVGTFDDSTTSTVVDANKKLQLMSTVVVELGPNGDDTIFTAAAIDRANIDQQPVDLDLAILGGTGRYKGATGEVIFTGTHPTKPTNLYVAEVAVPIFKRF